MPATSPAEHSTNSALKPLSSAHLRYMRNSISAQSWASVPPEPDWISRNAQFSSISPENIRRNSRLASWVSILSISVWTSPSMPSSFSSTAISRISRVSAMPESRSSMVFTTTSREDLSRPNSWARSGSFHTSGSDNSSSTSARRSLRLA